MGTFHFLNVNQGDCSIIQHASGNVSVIDVCNASKESEEDKARRKAVATLAKSFEAVRGNFNQKEYPVNPIDYLQSFGIDSIFRFILTHPDMDHMGGIEDFFDVFKPLNFWDTENHCEKDFAANGGPHNEDDWIFYTSLRDRDSMEDPKRLTLYAGAEGQFWNRGKDGLRGDGLHILAPTPGLIREANKTEDFNDGSYVLLYWSAGGRILLAGDSHDKTWEHVLENHAADVRDVDLLIAPHHGRASGRSYDFLDVVNPALTFFGNASSEHLAYEAWNSRDLMVTTNNQANCMVVDTDTKPMTLYVTNENYAKKLNENTLYSEVYRAYYCGTFGH